MISLAVLRWLGPLLVGFRDLPRLLLPMLRRLGRGGRWLWQLVRGLWLLWLIAAGLLIVAAILWAATVEPPWLLDTRDLSGLSPADQVKARSDLRTTLVTMLGGLAVLGGGVVAAANLALSQRVQWRAQVTERFSKAIEQLGQRGDDKRDVRIGAIYALEQIARDSTELHWPIMEVLTAYLREHAPVRPPATAPAAAADKRTPAADHQAIATVIGRRERSQDPDGQRLDLRRIDLPGVDWDRAHLEAANLREANLEGATLIEAQLQGANLPEAHLEGALLFNAHLEGANLTGAHLEKAHLFGTHLQRADLGDAHLEDTRLRKAHLEGPELPERVTSRKVAATATARGTRRRSPAR
jgi:hypothetical protein